METGFPINEASVIISCFAGTVLYFAACKNDRSRKGGRVVECAGLEIQCTSLAYRRFESDPFRQLFKRTSCAFSAGQPLLKAPCAARRPQKTASRSFCLLTEFNATVQHGN